MKEFVYKLILQDRLFVEDNWTNEDEASVAEHFAYLKQLHQEGTLILAGKTAGLDESTYGLVLFLAPDMDTAQAIMNHDPAVVNGTMTATLHEYNIALFQSNYKK